LSFRLAPGRAGPPFPFPGGWAWGGSLGGRDKIVFLGIMDSKQSEDRKFARLAIEEARRSVAEDDGRPHPLVGAIVVKNGEVLAIAHRGEGEGDHAEYIALEKRLPDAAVAGSTIYTTLEPCTTRNHPKIPCVDRLIERKVGRVVIGMLDPDPRITGRGQLNRECTRALELLAPESTVQTVSAYPQVDFEFKPEKILVGEVLSRLPYCVREIFMALTMTIATMDRGRRI